MDDQVLRVGLLWPSAAPLEVAPELSTTRLAGIAEALQQAGIDPVSVAYSDDCSETIEASLRTLDGVLVWVNPIEQGRDRTTLDAMLRRVAGAGVFVSAHPDVIEAIGTKEVLYRTRDMAWGTDTRMYAGFDAFRADFPATLALGPPRVLKQRRGNGGKGVWKVEREPDTTRAGAGSTPQVRVREAIRGASDEVLPLHTFMERCALYFDAGGCLIDQPYEPRLADGMVRCYLAGDRVVGFGEQLVNALLPGAEGSESATAPQPGPRLYYPPGRADLQQLKGMVEQAWLPELCRTTNIATQDLPIIWDIDLLHGGGDASGGESYVLCEINVSCVFPFPDEALMPLAQRVHERLSSGPMPA